MRLLSLIIYIVLAAAFVYWSYITPFAEGSQDAHGLYATLVAGGLIIGPIPTFIAFHNNHPRRWVILVLNIFLGFLLPVWFAILIWATRVRIGIPVVIVNRNEVLDRTT